MTDKPVTDETAHPPVASGSIFNLPNNLTIARIVMIPLFVAIAYWPPAMGIGQSAISDNAIANIGMYQFSDSLLRHFLLTAVFILAAITDWLDGYFARKLNMTSAFGRFLDPVADKLMVAAALIILVQWHPDIVMAISAIVIISREIAVSALREWMAELGNRTSVAVSYVGKMKTTFQMVAITVAVTWIEQLLSSYSKPIFTPSSGSWWQSGISSWVRLLAMTPAMWAVWVIEPFLVMPSADFITW